jgi:hypothetical protein
MDTNSRKGHAAMTSDLRADARPTPLLSIGLPVYNGAKHLRESIESLLAQDVEDLELVISDNASTDDTPAICAAYAKKDSRVRYSRNESNVGAAANYNRVFELSNGTYFMWGSDDDVWDPRFARLCIAKLEKHPAAVLCTSQLLYVDEHGARKPDQYPSLDTVGMSVEERVHEFVRRHGWYEVYSVFRPEALRATGMYPPSFGGDVHLLLELLLRGDFLAVPETLLHYRMPTRPKTAGEYLTEIGVSEGTGTQLERPWAFLARDLLGVLGDSALDTATTEAMTEDLIRTLSQESSVLGRGILNDRGLPPLPGWAAEPEIRAALKSDEPPLAPVSVTSAREVWQLREGTRLHGIRRLLLRVLQPFTDRQTEMTARQTALVALLAEEVERLSGRVEELETTTAPERSQPL